MLKPFIVYKYIINIYTNTQSSITCIINPDNASDRKYPNKLNTTSDTDEETARCRLGTIDTKIPEHAGNTEAPKNSSNQRNRAT